MAWVEDNNDYDPSAIDPRAVAAGQGVPSGRPHIQIGGGSPQAPAQGGTGQWVVDDTPEERSFGQEMARQGGLTVRHAIEGGMMLPAMVGDAANAAVNLGIRGANSAFGSNIPELRPVSSEISGILDRSGVPKPETGTERIVGEASRAIAGVPAFASGALSTGVRALAPLAENLGMQATSAGMAGGAYGAAKEAFPDSPGVQATAGLLGGVAGGLRAAEAAPEVAQRMGDFARSRIAPAIQDVSQSSTWQRLGKLLEAVPFTSDTVKAKELNRLRQAEQSAGRITDRLGTPGTAQRIGEQVQKGVEQFRFGKAQGMTPRQILTSPTRDSSIAAKANVLYNRVPVAEDAVVDMPETTAALRSAASKFTTDQLNRVFPTKMVEELATAIEGNGSKLPWKDVRRLRTELRYKRGQSALDPDIDDRALAELDNALGADMLTGAKAAGGDRAVEAITRADRYYALSMQGLTDKLKTIFNSNRPEQVYAQIESAISAKPNKADYGKLLQLRKALPKEAWDDIAATIVENLGRPSAGRALPQDMPQFSAAEFVTKFGNMSQGAKTLLFDGAGRGDLRGSLEALNRTLANMKNTDRLSNVSQSGNSMINFGTAAGALAKPHVVIPALAASNITARAMYNPTFVKLMTKSLRGGDPATVQQTALQLTKFAQENPSFADDIAGLMQNLVPVRAEQNEQTRQGNR